MSASRLLKIVTTCVHAMHKSANTTVLGKLVHRLLAALIGAVVVDDHESPLDHEII